MFLSRKDLFRFYVISRPRNIVIALAVFAFASYVSGLGTFKFIEDRRFYLQALTMAAIMAGGYWINDVFDHKIDRINKPEKTIVGRHISTKKTLTGYWAVNIFATVLTVFLPVKFWMINFGTMAALFVYAAYLKRYAVWGNLTIAVLTALPVITGAMLYHFKPVHLWAAVLAFWVNFIREIVKDVEDVRGDLTHGLQTLPIKIGLRSTKTFLFVNYFILFVHLSFPAFFYYYWDGVTVVSYLILTTVLVVPIWGICLKELIFAIKPADYKRQSKLLKFMMALGLICLLSLPI